MNPALSPALLPSAAKAVGRGPPTGGQVMLVECAPQGGPLQSAAVGGAPGPGDGLTCRWPRLRPRNRKGGLFFKGPPIPPTPHQPRILYLPFSLRGGPPGAARRRAPGPASVMGTAGRVSARQGQGAPPVIKGA